MWVTKGPRPPLSPVFVPSSLSLALSRSLVSSFARPGLLLSSVQTEGRGGGLDGGPVDQSSPCRLLISCARSQSAVVAIHGPYSVARTR